MTPRLRRSASYCRRPRKAGRAGCGLPTLVPERDGASSSRTPRLRRSVDRLGDPGAHRGRRKPRGAFSYLAWLARADGSYRYSAKYVTTSVWVTSYIPAALRKTFPRPLIRARAGRRDAPAAQPSGRSRQASPHSSHRSS
jgi:hypothetical protein